MKRIRVVFEAETGNGTNIYWIGKEGEEPIGQIQCSAEMATSLHTLINEMYCSGGCTHDCSYCHMDEDEEG